MKSAELINSMRASHAAQLKLLRDNAADIDTIAEELEILKVDLVRFGLDSYNDFCISFAGDQKAFRKVWAILRAKSYVPASRPDNERHTSFNTSFTKLDSDGIKIDGSLPIWFSFSSTTCKVVKTGVKMVEESVYEVQCD